MAFQAPSCTVPVTAAPSTVTAGGVPGAPGSNGAGGVRESSLQAARYSPPKSPLRNALSSAPPSGTAQVTVARSPGLNLCSSGVHVPAGSSVPASSVMWKRMSAGPANSPVPFVMSSETLGGESGEACEGISIP